MNKLLHTLGNVVPLSLLILVISIFTPAKAQTISTNAQIVQSPYYDAIALYYGLAGYSVYPVYLKNEDTSSKSSLKTAAKNTSPGGDGTTNKPDNTTKPLAKDSVTNSKSGESGNQDTKSEGYIKIYKIVESATGKIITDHCIYDSIQIYLVKYKIIGDEKTAFIDEILRRNNGTPDVDHDSLIRAYVENKYLYDLLVTKDSLKNKIDFTKGSLQIPPDFGEGFPSLSTIVEGLADFYIERVNEEINDAFFIRLYDVLDKSPELKILFPNTLESLKKIEVTKYNQSLNAIKAAFKIDIKNILSNIADLATLPKYQDLIKVRPVLTLLFTTCDLISLLNKGNSPADILYYINHRDYITNTGINNFNSTIKLAALISYCFTDVKIGDENLTNTKWISTAKINNLKNNKDLFRVFMGLFTQNARGIKFGNFDFYHELNNDTAEVLAGQYIVYNFSQTVKSLNETITTFQLDPQNAKGLATKVNLFIDITNQVISLADKGVGVLRTTKPVLDLGKTIKKLKEQYIPYLQKADTIIYHIEQEEYSMAIYEADSLIGFIFDTQKKWLKDNNTITGKDKKTSSDTMDKVRNNFLHYGLFIAAVAEAKDASDVKETIKAFALPKGSSRIKKEHHFSWGINSYVGVYHSWNTQYRNVTLAKEETGITAPLGVALNLGKFLRGSFTIYGGVIDIGAIFTFKVRSDSSIKSDIQLGQILSPSIGIVYGFPIIKRYNIPLSLGFNYQWGPKLKKVDDKNNSVLPLLAGRINIFLAVDIPIINFHVSRE